MIEMKARTYGLALATLLVVASTLAGHAEDAATSPADNSPAATQTQTQSPPASVARPSIVPKTTERAATEPPPSRDAAADPTRPRQHRSARRHTRRYASDWMPFPIYLPHLYHSRIVWSRLPWFSF
jgi:hypothetical protein